MGQTSLDLKPSTSTFQLFTLCKLPNLPEPQCTHPLNVDDNKTQTPNRAVGVKCDNAWNMPAQGKHQMDTGNDDDGDDDV